MRSKQSIAILVAYFGIDPDAEIAFRARLKHFQRLGFPRGVNTGKGKQVDYSRESVLFLGCALSLSLSGVSPERAAEIVKASEDEIGRSVKSRASCQLSQPRGVPDFVRMAIDAFKIDDAIGRSLER